MFPPKFSSNTKIILDTDIGDDIDDSFSLAYLLNTVPGNISMILTCFGRTEKRAAILASQLSRCGMDHLLIGKGPENPDFRDPYMFKFCDFDINSYKNYCENGIDKALDLIRSDPENTVIIALGPATNLALMLEKEPDLMASIPVFAMFGSIHRGYFGNSVPDREYNAFADTDASKKIVAGLRNLFIAPLDTCGIIKFSGDFYSALMNSQNPITKPVIDDFKNWLTLWDPNLYIGCTSVLYDIQPIYMLLDGSELLCESLPLSVDDNGNTVVDIGGKNGDANTGNMVYCALNWKNMDAFLESFVHVME